MRLLAWDVGTLVPVRQTPMSDPTEIPVHPRASDEAVDIRWGKAEIERTGNGGIGLSCTPPGVETPKPHPSGTL